MVIKLTDVIFALSIIELISNNFTLWIYGNIGRCHLSTNIEKNDVQVVELAGVILAISIKILVDIIFALPLKANNGGKTAQPRVYRFIAAGTSIKLYYLTSPTHWKALAPISKAKKYSD